MENIAKALLIAAGILFSVMLLSMLMITYNQISSHYQQKHELAVMEQVERFNREFENYNRQYIRGNDLISFMNKVIDYNAGQAYNEGISSKRILVEINMVPEGKDVETIMTQFKWPTEGKTSIENASIIDLDENGKITNIGGEKYISDKELIKITGTPNELISQAKDIKKYDGQRLNITDTELQKLSSDIGNIVLTDIQEGNEEEYSKHFHRARLLKYILGLSVGNGDEFDIQIDNETGIIEDGESFDKIEKIKEIACQYYQYTQFKRACFRCTKVEYDLETKRIVGMNFEVQIKDDGNVIFD